MGLKGLRKGIRQKVAADHPHIVKSAAFQVLFKKPQTNLLGIDCCDVSGPRNPIRNLQGLSSRSGAQIEDFFSRLWIEQLDCMRGSGILDVCLPFLDGFEGADLASSGQEQSGPVRGKAGLWNLVKQVECCIHEPLRKWGWRCCRLDSADQRFEEDSGNGVVEIKPSFPLFRPEAIQSPIHQPLGVRGSQ